MEASGNEPRFTVFKSYLEYLVSISNPYLINIWQMSWRPNQISYRKLYFTDFVQNSLRFNIGILFFLTSNLRGPPLTLISPKALSSEKQFLIQNVQLKHRKANISISHKKGCNAWLIFNKHEIIIEMIFLIGAHI